MLFSDEYRTPAPSARISFSGFRSTGSEPLDAKLGPLTIVVPSQEYRFLGQAVSLGPVQMEVTQLQLVRQVPMAKPGWFKLSLVGTESSERIIQHKGVVYHGNPCPE